jgi:hypothetical protein
MVKVLLEKRKIKANEKVRLMPGLDVERWDRLHFHISGGSRAIANLNVRVLFGTPVSPIIMLADSTVWFEQGVSEREFSYQTSANYNGTGFVMSVPVVAPLLYDVILHNVGGSAIETAYVTVMTQEI